MAHRIDIDKWLATSRVLDAGERAQVEERMDRFEARMDREARSLPGMARWIRDRLAEIEEKERELRKAWNTHATAGAALDYDRERLRLVKRRRGVERKRMDMEDLRYLHKRDRKWIAAVRHRLAEEAEAA